MGKSFIYHKNMIHVCRSRRWPVQGKAKVCCNEQQTEILWSEYTVLRMVRTWVQADLVDVYCQLSFPIITRLRDFLNWSIVYYDVSYT